MDKSYILFALEESYNKADVKDSKLINKLKVEFLGKKGIIATEMAKMREIASDERAKFGQEINAIKNKIECFLGQKLDEIEQIELTNRIKNEKIDITLPGYNYSVGTLHPLTLITEQITKIFKTMGYSVVLGPEVETEELNFEKLNIPADHPARDMQDSFYINPQLLLRTHTSPSQARTMLAKNGQGPIRIIAPGKVYRRDDDDATHSHQFTQIEALCVAKNVSMSDLKGTLLMLAQEMFGKNAQIRMRPSYFPFTEPSTEVDVTCHKCSGKGCSICKGTGWIEVLGAGMVHPNVLKGCGFDPEVYSGFALGLGVERFAMLKYGINDIRDLYTNDIRFLKQFKGEK